jgi:mono/diheme cytochrome c family protein
MKTDYFTITIVCSGILFGVFGLTRAATKKAGEPATAAAKADPVVRGRYLIKTSGCNDCHTPRFMELGDKVPESEWLTGSSMGWRGPWGTSYPGNLRRHMAAHKDVDLWIKMVRGRNGLPPMPWPSLHAMTDEDLKAVHAYISSLEVKGDFTPAPVPPDKEPSTPYLNLEPVMPKTAAVPARAGAPDTKSDAPKKTEAPAVSMESVSTGRKVPAAPKGLRVLR